MPHEVQCRGTFNGQRVLGEQLASTARQTIVPREFGLVLGKRIVA